MRIQYNFENNTQEFIVLMMKDEPSLYALVSEDYRRTGRCNVAFAKESFGSVIGGWAISKNNSRFETYQRGYITIKDLNKKIR